ncbi:MULTISPECIES: DUF6073 family protein [unclassified Nonomuraea]|uniref:DUF6073 family protein n=1 Tax=Nonomuraea sp. NPDC003804 TaxID=3154547 RepID=UPI0033B52457
MTVNYFPPAGTDYLRLWTDAVIELAGGEETIEADGWFCVTRSNPERQNPNAIVTQIIQMYLPGRSEHLGNFVFSLNPQIPTMGEETTFAVNKFDSRFKGYFNVYFQLELLDQGKTLINKEPVVIEGVFGALPPIGAIGEMAPGDRVGMYDKDNPDSEPVMYMLATRKIVGQYVTGDYAARKEDFLAVKEQAAEFARTGRLGSIAEV